MIPNTLACPSERRLTDAPVLKGKFVGASFMEYDLIGDFEDIMRE